jgi:hypothetical protein
VKQAFGIALIAVGLVPAAGWLWSWFVNTAGLSTDIRVLVVMGEVAFVGGGIFLLGTARKSD